MKRFGLSNRFPLRHVRYGFAILGPVSTAGSQFVLTLQLLHALNPASFGSFSFLLIASQLSTGISSALLCAPLPVLLSAGDEDARRTVQRCLFATNLCMTGSAFVAFYILAIALGISALASLLFAVYAALILLRWYARAYTYAFHIQWKTVTSDLIYGVVLLGGIALMPPESAASLTAPCLALLIAAAVSLLPFGRIYLGQQFLQFSLRDLLSYKHIWRLHSSWSLTGVLTTEATANAHAYILTLFSGPAEFARVAASAILIRPVTVAMNALSEFERPQLARQLAGGSKDTAGTIRFFRGALIAVWAATGAASAILMLYAPRLMFPPPYSRNDMIAGSILWLTVAGVRLLRMPESTLLQAAGQFRTLAFASVLSCGLSIAAVIVFLVAGGPLWSIMGILLGEALFAFSIFRRARSWSQETQS